MLVIQVEDCNTFVARSLKIESLIKSDTDSNLDNLVRRVNAEVVDIPLPRNYILRYFTRERCIEDTSETLIKLLSHLILDVKQGMCRNRIVLANVFCIYSTRIGLCLKPPDSICVRWALH